MTPKPEGAYDLSLVHDRAIVAGFFNICGNCMAIVQAQAHLNQTVKFDEILVGWVLVARPKIQFKYPTA
ncbi:hypothetical protein QUB70_18790 [Microcoleus sp. A003_D6]|uniref:hypothetical protein n=1 Tax=Microcoleus sp. A003_D6 TaxID=3055266 RepID=UPI002FD7247B